MMKCVFIVY